MPADAVSPADGGTTTLADAEAWARGMVEREPWYAGRDELARLLAGLASLRRELSESLTAQARLAGAVASPPCPSCATAAAPMSHKPQITDTSGVAPERTAMPDQHSLSEACYYCASDDELARAVAGERHRTIHMDTSAAQCPVWTPRETSADA